MQHANLSYLPTRNVHTSHLYLRAWGRQMLRALGFVGMEVEQREAWLWAHAEAIAAVHEGPEASVDALYQCLVALAVRGRGGVLSDE